jgi:hypothetical protein
MKILLFDMDGVLLESRGYHLALQETVRRMAAALGFAPGSLSADDIAVFESAGITCEWDSAAICAAQLLTTVWQDRPNCPLPLSLAALPPLPAAPRPLPDFGALAAALGTPDQIGLHPLERAERHFLADGGLSPTQTSILLDLIRTARDRERSLTHRTFQELVLGSREFAHSHGMPAVLECESYLSKYDRSSLTPADANRLERWVSIPGQRAVIITSRPSRPPEGIFSTPEAELGAQLVGLPELPILGWGGICWLGQQHEVDPQSFLKPSPIHALAGLRMAMGEMQETALTAAWELVENRRIDATWRALSEAEVAVFEDTPGGIRSLREASKVLGDQGIAIDSRYFGITQKPVKAAVLLSLGALIHPTPMSAWNDWIPG